MPTLELNHRRRQFIANYLESGNATQAAIAAGYAPNSAGVHASRLLADPTVSAVIDSENAARLERLSVSADWIVSRLKAEALDRSPDSSHGARVAALTTLSKISGLYQKEAKAGSHVEFVINLGDPSEPSPMLERVT